MKLNLLQKKPSSVQWDLRFGPKGLVSLSARTRCSWNFVLAHCVRQKLVVTLCVFRWQGWHCHQAGILVRPTTRPQSCSHSFPCWGQPSHCRSFQQERDTEPSPSQPFKVPPTFFQRPDPNRPAPCPQARPASEKQESAAGTAPRGHCRTQVTWIQPLAGSG